MNSVIKAFKVLQTFSLEKPELSFTEIVKSTGLGTTNTHKLLKTLVSLNCLAQSNNGKPYRLGPKLFELGSQYIAQLNLCRLATPYLLKLAEESEQTVYLCIEDKGEALCLERIDGPSPVKITALQTGGRLPLHTGAAPLVLLSSMKDQEIVRIMKAKGFRKLTEHTIQDMDQLLEEVKRVRKRGYSISRQDVTIGVASFGAAIRDDLGKVVGAISIGGLILHYKGNRKEYLLNLLKETALAISKELGHKP